MWAARVRTLRGVSTTVGWLLSGKVVALAANGVLVVILARLLAPENFGLVVSALSGQIIVSRVLLLGTDVGTFRVETLEPRWAPHVAGASLLLVLSSIAVASVLAIFTTLPFSVRHLPGPPWFGPVVVAGAAGMALHDYLYWRRLAKIGHRAATLMTSATTISRLGLVVALLVAGVRNPLWLLVVMAAVPLTIASALLWQSNPTFRGLPRATMSVLLRYCGWQAASNIVGTLTLQQGTLLLSLLRKPADAGAFGLAITVGAAANLVTQSVQEFLTARVFRLDAEHDIGKFLLKSTAMVLAIAVGVSAVLLSLFAAIALLLHSRVPISAGVFVPVTAALTVLLLHTPFEAVCHFLVRPDAILASKSLRLLIGFGLGMLWGAQDGAPGVCNALLTGTVASLFMIAGFTIRWLVKGRPATRGCAGVDG